MKTFNVIIALCMVCCIAITSCNKNEVHTTQIEELTNEGFSYSEYVSARVTMENEMRQESRSKISVENSVFISEKLGGEDAKKEFLRNLQKTNREIKSMTFPSAVDYSVNNGVLTTDEGAFLKQTFLEIEKIVDAAPSILPLHGYLLNRFDATNLAERFDGDGILKMQLFGYAFLYEAEMKEISQLRGCNFLQAIGCGALATVGGVVAAVVVGFFDACTVNGEQASLVVCAAILGVTVWALIYKWCCGDGGDEDPCADSTDLCCGVICPPGYFCNITGICFIPTPPPNQNGDECITVDHCPDDGKKYKCINGHCIEF